jgi:ribosomal protein S18 acetylase RimI-like enzyme
MNTTIRPMQAADKPAVMHILQNTPEFLPEEVIVAEELIDAYLESPGGDGYYILVAETNGKVSGYSCYGETPLTTGTWDVYWIAVDRKQQGSGIGGALMKVTEDKISAAKGRLVMIETSAKPNYDKTRRFYASQHYTEIALIPDFYTVGDDKVILMKNLK